MSNINTNQVPSLLPRYILIYNNQNIDALYMDMKQNFNKHEAVYHFLNIPYTIQNGIEYRD